MEEKSTVKKFPLWGKIVIGVMVVPFIAGLGTAIFAPGGPETDKKIAEQNRQDSIQAKADSIQLVLSSIRYYAKKTVKENLKDPDSFEEIEHQEYQVTNPSPLLYYQASIKYRAKNSFGGFVIEKRCFDFLENGVATKSFVCN